MQEQVLFYAVFFSQIVLISYYLPRQVLQRLRHVAEKYPPEEYPRLYPVSMDKVERARRNYRNLNALALVVGLALLLAAVLSAREEMLGWDTTSVVMLYWVLQFSPLVIALSGGFVYFNLKRRADSRTTRRADLRPRRLSDFVSPALLGSAVAVYVAFVALVAWVNRFDFPWFGGYWNVVGITAANLLFAFIVVHNLRGKKKDPYQDPEDRMRQIGRTINLLVITSIVATLFVAMMITLRALDQHGLTDAFQSLYLQLVTFISFRGFRIDDVNFEVYREDPAIA